MQNNNDNRGGLGRPVYFAKDVPPPMVNSQGLRAPYAALNYAMPPGAKPGNLKNVPGPTGREFDQMADMVKTPSADAATSGLQFNAWRASGQYFPTSTTGATPLNFQGLQQQHMRGVPMDSPPGPYNIQHPATSSFHPNPMHFNAVLSRPAQGPEQRHMSPALPQMMAAPYQPSQYHNLAAYSASMMGSSPPFMNRPLQQYPFSDPQAWTQMAKTATGPKMYNAQTAIQNVLRPERHNLPIPSNRTLGRPRVSIEAASSGGANAPPRTSSDTTAKDICLLLAQRLKNTRAKYSNPLSITKDQGAAILEANRNTTTSPFTAVSYATLCQIKLAVPSQTSTATPFQNYQSVDYGSAHIAKKRRVNLPTGWIQVEATNSNELLFREQFVTGLMHHVGSALPLDVVMDFNAEPLSSTSTQHGSDGGLVHLGHRNINSDRLLVANSTQKVNGGDDPTLGLTHLATEGLHRRIRNPNLRCSEPVPSNCEHAVMAPILKAYESANSIPLEGRKYVAINYEFLFPFVVAMLRRWKTSPASQNMSLIPRIAPARIRAWNNWFKSVRSGHDKQISNCNHQTKAISDEAFFFSEPFELLSGGGPSESDVGPTVEEESSFEHTSYDTGGFESLHLAVTRFLPSEGPTTLLPISNISGASPEQKNVYQEFVDGHFWGESVDFDDTQTLLLHFTEGDILPERFTEDEMDRWENASSQWLLDAEDLVALRAALHRSCSAFRCKKTADKLLAFGTAILDPNDASLFLEESRRSFDLSLELPESMSEHHLLRSKQLNSPNASAFNYIENRGHQLDASSANYLLVRPDGTSVKMSYLEADNAAFSDADRSTGSLSDVEDLAFPSAVIPSGSQPGNSSAAGVAETAANDSARQIELKRRMQEKEMRIKSALMGLGPKGDLSISSSALNTSAGNSDDASAQANQSQLPSSNTRSALTALSALRGRNRRLPDPMSEYRLIRQKFLQTSGDLFARLQISFDTTLKDPYVPSQRPTGDTGSKLKFLDLKHTAPAYAFAGVPTKPFASHINRFHRPDFRWGLFEAHMLHASQKQPLRTPVAGFGRPATGIKLSIGRRVDASSHLWGTWVVRAPHLSDVLKQNRLAAVEMNDISVNQGHDYSDGGTTSKHPGASFINVDDLSLEDITPFAILEYIEQRPKLFNNLGMAAKISRIYRPLSTNVTIEQAMRKVKARLGRFGQLRLSPDGLIPLFGTHMRLARNQGTVIYHSQLLKGPLFPHPQNPGIAPIAAPPLEIVMETVKTTEAESVQTRRQAPRSSGPGASVEKNPIFRNLSHWRYGTGRFHDFRRTDFLLIRRSPPITSLMGGHVSPGTASPLVSVHLRPLWLEGETPTTKTDNLGAGDMGFDISPQVTGFSLEELLSQAGGCTVYTVGQTQPLVEVPAPTAKRCLEIRRDWMRSFALRLARQGVTDFQQVKSRCQVKFSFEANVLQKHLLACKEPNSGAPGTGEAPTIRVIEEGPLREICGPESVSALESAIVSNAHLQQTGLHLLRDGRIYTAVNEIERREARARDAQNAATKAARKMSQRLRSLYTAVESKLPPHTASVLEPLVQAVCLKAVKGFWSDIIFAGGLTASRRLGPVARLIEELLLLTPWNVTKECLEVTSRHGGQFSLDAVGDPSGSRNEGISLIRSNRRETLAESLQQRQNAELSSAPKEDLRRLSMKELRARLLKLGFDDSTVKSLPRWDQVALVRRFQVADDGRNPFEDLRGSAGRLSSDAYNRRLNEIFLRQRRALEPDNPEMTSSEESGPELEDIDELRTSKSAVSAGGGAAAPVAEEVFPTNQIAATDQDFSQPMGTSSAEIAPSPYTLGTPVEDSAKLEDELLSGLDFDVPDARQSTLNEAEDDSYGDALELEDLRRSLRSTAETAASPMNQHFSLEELRLMGSNPIPRVTWIRKLRNPRPGQPAEKVVYIYGEENVRLFYEWRRRRALQKPYSLTAVAASSGSVGTASRTCRRCGQLGHISSNPVCPKYDGPRKTKGSSSSSVTLGSSASTLGARAMRLATLLPTGEEDETESQTASVSSLATGGRRKGDKKGSRNGKNRDSGSEVGSASFAPTRTTVRQRHLLEQRGGTVPPAAYTGTFEGAVAELNQILQRVTWKTNKDRRRFMLFRYRVTDADAPGYSSVVKDPMWLDKMVDKCKSHAYLSREAYMQDVNLLVANCYAYNPAGHWIRPVVDALKVFLEEELKKEGLWLSELERYIQQHIEEQQSALSVAAQRMRQQAP